MQAIGVRSEDAMNITDKAGDGAQGGTPVEDEEIGDTERSLIIKGNQGFPNEKSRSGDKRRNWPSENSHDARSSCCVYHNAVTYRIPPSCLRR